MNLPNTIKAMPIRHDKLTFAQRLNECMDDLGMKPRGRQAWLKDRFGVSQPTAKGWLDDDFMPDRTKLVRMAAEFGVRLEWLITGQEPKKLSVASPMAESSVIPGAVDMREIPLVSYVEAGVWSDSNDPYARGDGMEAIGVDPDLAAHLSRVAFALKIQGQSMEPEFQQGDVIIVDPNVAPRPGDFVVAKLDDAEKATFKKYRDRGLDRDGNRMIELAPLNPDFPTLFIDADRPGRIIGTMIEHRRRRRF
ncbi:Cro/Cl family transcriptional regulator [Dyella jiangningensis]|nr:Cro/Cl family transcriptional regulator [Dyella jiangningensis]